MEIYYQLFENSPDSVIVVDRKGCIARVNVQSERIFGYTRDEFIGQPVEMLIAPQLVPGHVARRADYMANPLVRMMGAGMELFGRRKDGGEFPVEIMLSSAETKEGRLVLAVVRDITERKRAEEAQISLIAQLQHALKEVRTLRGILPICGYCKKIRTDTGSWQKIESYLKEHSDADFSHGICPSCFEQKIAELKQEKPS